MINLSRKIRELRKKKGLTQEQLALILNISPKTVSKWETNETVPDIALIFELADFFGVSLDVLFDYDPERKKKKLEDIFEKSRQVFWSNFDECERILKEALEDYPSSDKLKGTLLSLYECHMRCHGKTDRIDDGIALAKDIIETSEDFIGVCQAKHDLASMLIKKDRYNEAKEVLLTLPDRAEYSYEDRAFLLHGQDRLDAAIPLRSDRIQCLFSACSLTGEGYFEIKDYENALFHFKEAVKVIEMFMKSSEICYDSYLWQGMQTHHWYNYLGAAASLYHLGKEKEGSEYADKAYHIISHSWDDEFDDDREDFMKYFRDDCKKFNLDKYWNCP